MADWNCRWDNRDGKAKQRPLNNKLKKEPHLLSVHGWIHKAGTAGAGGGRHGLDSVPPPCFHPPHDFCIVSDMQDLSTRDASAPLQILHWSDLIRGDVCYSCASADTQHRQKEEREKKMQIIASLFTAQIWQLWATSEIIRALCASVQSTKQYTELIAACCWHFACLMWSPAVWGIISLTCCSCRTRRRSPYGQWEKDFFIIYGGSRLTQNMCLVMQLTQNKRNLSPLCIWLHLKKYLCMNPQHIRN